MKTATLKKGVIINNIKKEVLAILVAACALSASAKSVSNAESSNALVSNIPVMVMSMRAPDPEPPTPSGQPLPGVLATVLAAGLGLAYLRKKKSSKKA